MGGDHAPLEVVAGTLAWARKHPSDTILLVGRPEAIEKAAGGPLPTNVEVIAASQVVEMDESPAAALKTKKDSSIMVAMDLIKQGKGTPSSRRATRVPAWPPPSSGSVDCGASTARRWPSRW